MADFYIMNAQDHLTGKRKNSLEDVIKYAIEDGGDSTILVCERDAGRDALSPLFVLGSGAGGYGMKPGSTALYTQDTGNGHKFKNFDLYINNVITIDSAGNVSYAIEEEYNKAGLWVMK